MIHLTQENFPKTTYVGENFSEAVFDGVDFGGMIFEGCEFRNAAFRNCTVNEKDFPVMFLRCSLQGVLYRECDGKAVGFGCDFAGAEENTPGSFAWTLAESPGELLEKNRLGSDLIVSVLAACIVTASAFVGCLAAACYLVS